MPHSLLRKYPSLFDLVYVSSYLFESDAFRKIGSTDPNPQSTLSKAYLSMSDGDFIWRQGAGESGSKNADRLLLVTPFMARRNDPMLLLCVKNRRFDARSPWYADRLIPRSVFEKNGQFIGLPEGEWLKNWAVIRHGESNDYFGALDALAKMTHPNEIWYYGQSEDPGYPILGNYLRYTFYKLWIDGKIGYSADNTLAAFNTGLVDSKYEFIYAVFERINPQNGKCWSLKGFCIPGEQGLGKELLRQFRNIPQPARFFDRTSQLIYEINYDLSLERQMPYVDYEHIIRDNLSRFPLTFLKSISFGYNEVFALLEKVPTVTTRAALDELWDKIVSKIDDDLFLRIKSHIERALGTAMRRVLWNYKTAIPVYYPAKDTISWLLPLALTPGRQADVALVVERFGSGNLVGHTILDLDMAYTNARLISKPESDWLNPTSIEIGMETRLELRDVAPEALRRNSKPAAPASPAAKAAPAAEPEKSKKSGAFSLLASALNFFHRSKETSADTAAPTSVSAAPDKAAETKSEPRSRKEQGAGKPADKQKTRKPAQKQEPKKQKEAPRQEKEPKKKQKLSDRHPVKEQPKEKPVITAAPESKNNETSPKQEQAKKHKAPAENKKETAKKQQNEQKAVIRKDAPVVTDAPVETPVKAEKPTEIIPEPETSGKLDAAISAGFLPNRPNLDLETISRHPKRRALAESEQPAQAAIEVKEETAAPPIEPAKAEETVLEPAKKKRRRRGSKKPKAAVENIEAVSAEVKVSEEKAAVEAAPKQDETAETPAKKKSRRRRSKKKKAATAAETPAAESAVSPETAPEKEADTGKPQEPAKKKSRRRSGAKNQKSETASAAKEPSEHSESVSRSLIGKEITLEQVKVRKGHRGIQGYYQGVLVTVAPNQMPNAPESYPGTDFKVRILKVNPQGTQYIGRIPK